NTRAKQQKIATDVIVNNEELHDEDEDEEEEETKKKKGMKPIVLIAFLVVFWVLFFDEDEKKSNVITPQQVSITFPSQGEYLDEVKAKQALAQGLELYATQTYINLVKAAGAFKLSLFHKFKDNPALGYLIMSYARLYPNAKNQLEASTTLFNLVRLSQDKLLT